jgi:hypothetical protein
MSTARTSDRISHVLGLAGHALLLPWPARSKGNRRKWGHLRLSDMNDATYVAKLDKAGNIGVALGKVSNGLVTIDLDQDIYVEAFLEENPLLHETLQTRGSRGCNIWVRCSGEYPSSQKLRDLSGSDIGEWRADGNQTIITGTHPEGMSYKFVVEGPVVTIRYDAIAWPRSIIPPHATESKRVRGVKEDKVVSLSGGGACDSIEAFCAGHPISKIAPTGPHQNNDSLFKLARLVRSFESAAGRLATPQELSFVFDQWCQLARRFWRSGLTRDDYRAEVLEAYSYARIGLGEDPIPVALDRARRRPLPEVAGFGDERVKLLAGICRQLHEMMGGSSFFLPTRKMGKVFGVHYTQVAHWLQAFEFLKIIHLAPGEVRRRGCHRSPRFLYGPPPQANGPVECKATV